jgi:hypothetical protein
MAGLWNPCFKKNQFISSEVCDTKQGNFTMSKSQLVTFYEDDMQRCSRDVWIFSGGNYQNVCKLVKFPRGRNTFLSRGGAN